MPYRVGGVVMPYQKDRYVFVLWDNYRVFYFIWRCCIFQATADSEDTLLIEERIQLG